MDHGPNPPYGYLLPTDGGAFGYTGDTTECPGVEALLSDADVAVVDTSFRETTATHLGVEYVRGMRDRFGVDPVFGVHRSREIYNEVEALPNVVLPTDGDVYEP